MKEGQGGIIRCVEVASGQPAVGPTGEVGTTAIGDEIRDRNIFDGVSYRNPSVADAPKTTRRETWVELMNA